MKRPGVRTMVISGKHCSFIFPNTQSQCQVTQDWWTPAVPNLKLLHIILLPISTLTPIIQTKWNSLKLSKFIKKFQMVLIKNIVFLIIFYNQYIFDIYIGWINKMDRSVVEHCTSKEKQIELLNKLNVTVCFFVTIFFFLFLCYNKSSN